MITRNINILFITLLSLVVLSASSFSQNRETYSQILVNGRPIFSSLTGLYGLEQIPSNMIQQIEVVRGGGSALYGSSAIGGTVNII